MAEKQRTYLAIDLKSFYASVECMERNLDPMNTHLVVADGSRTEKTICLAVSPALKSFGIPGRPRLFEVVESVKEINALRQRRAPGHRFTGESFDRLALTSSPDLALSYITAPPRMALYVDYSTRIYDIYLKYIAPEDIHVYSIDEVLIDVTAYLDTYRLTPQEMAMALIGEVLKATGVTATAGIGTNLYLAKVAMDILAKRSLPDKDGVRMAQLDEMSYRKLLWGHRPLTDFWGIGKAHARKLKSHGLYTMGDIARCSLSGPGSMMSEDLLYQLFGVNAELLIDHAWGWEPVTLADVKAYRPKTNSIGSGQVLHHPYPFDKAKLIAREMTDLLVLDLVDKGLVSDQIVITVGYDIENLLDPKISKSYKGEVIADPYGRSVPKPAHGTANLGAYSSSTRIIMNAAMALFDRIVSRQLLVRRVNITANHVVREESVQKPGKDVQLDFFTDYEADQAAHAQEERRQDRERRVQETVLKLKKKLGKNAVLKGMNLEEDATTISRNQQIGGHKE